MLVWKKYGDGWLGWRVARTVNITLSNVWEGESETLTISNNGFLPAAASAAAIGKVSRFLLVC